ncbi:MAG: 1-acyl-sn-glycerol-3-phosphate acyltransferase [Bacteroidota bacterium]
MTELPSEFDPIRPYFDHEVNDVLQRLSGKKSFLALMSFLFPEQSTEDIIANFDNIHSTFEFQRQYIHQGIRRIMEDSTTSVTHSGLADLPPDQAYLFISNHRDIILDPGILNVLLFEHHIETTQNAIGDNLVETRLVNDLMKLNKSFVVHRNPERANILPFAKRLSTYIRHILKQKRKSIWLAQRNGRTKDGSDRTHPGMLKMLNMSGSGTLVERTRALQITPMAISYEFEPCDGLKAEELVHQKLGLPYEKDDRKGIIEGIRGQKGRVHLALGRPLDQTLEEIDATLPAKKWLSALAGKIDEQIYQLYTLWPSHYIAADMIQGSTAYANQYRDEHKEGFIRHMEKRLRHLKGPREALERQFLEIYAAPVFNACGTPLPKE